MKTIELSVLFITVYVLQQMLGCLIQSELVHIPSSCYHMGGLISYLHHQRHHADFSTKNDLMAFSRSHDSLLRFVLWKIIPSAIRPLVMFSNKYSINPKSVNSLPLLFFIIYSCVLVTVYEYTSQVSPLTSGSLRTTCGIGIVDPRDWTQIVRLGFKRLYILVISLVQEFFFW